MITDIYTKLTNRNIGLLTQEQQNKLKDTCVLVAGLGGIGSPVAEMLARSGIGHLKIIDSGTFEPTNLNRQIFCFADTLDLKKTDVTEKYLKMINPDIRIEKYDSITEDNINEIIAGVNVVCLCIDHTRSILILSRKCREIDIPLIEGWALPYSNVRVFTKNTPSLEDAYNMPTSDRKISDIDEVEGRSMLLASIMKIVSDTDGLTEASPKAGVDRLINKGEGSTLAPMVWMTSCLMAIETIKTILGWGKIAFAPDFEFYDAIEHRLPKRK